MLLNLPTSYHLCENIHEYSDIDEVSFETAVGNIAHPDLITSGDIKVFKAMVPRDTHPQGMSWFDRHV